MPFEQGFTPELFVLTAACVLLAGIALASRLPPALLVVALIVRFTIPLLYFGAWHDGTWSLVDDITYFRQGQALLTRGVDPVGFFFDRHALTWLFVESRGNHILYGWFNLLAQWLAGPHYYAPVLLNVVMTFWAARTLYDIVRLATPERTYAVAVTGLFLFHWDVIAWSSFLNMKDNLVLLLTIWLVRGYLGLGRPGRRWALLSVVVVSFLLLWLRFYVPLLMGVCFAFTSALGDRARLRRRGAILVLSIAFVVGLVAAIGPGLLRLAWSRLDLSPGSLIVGITRIILTPQPWSVSEANGFLLIPSVLHLVMLPATAIGLVLLWRELPVSRLPVLYALLVLGIFAIFPLQLGPRHRYQVVFVTCWAQVHTLWHLALHLRDVRLGSRASDPIPLS